MVAKNLRHSVAPVALLAGALLSGAAHAQSCIGPAVASGTGDAFAIGCLPSSPGIANVIAPGPNTISAPTFAIPGQEPKTILRQDGSALAIGDISGTSNAILLFSDGAHWRLVNPDTAGALGNALTIGAHLTGGSYNGSAPVTIATDGASANTASASVARDSDKNFVAGTNDEFSLTTAGILLGSNWQLQNGLGNPVPTSLVFDNTGSYANHGSPVAITNAGISTIGQGNIYVPTDFALFGTAWGNQVAQYTGTTVGAALTVSSVSGTVAIGNEVVCAGCALSDGTYPVITAGAGSSWTLSGAPAGGNLTGVKMTSLGFVGKGTGYMQQGDRTIANITGSVSGTTLTTTNNTLLLGSGIIGTGVTNGTWIVGGPVSAGGGNYTYTLSANLGTIPSESMTVYSKSVLYGPQCTLVIQSSRGNSPYDDADCMVISNGSTTGASGTEAIYMGHFGFASNDWIAALGIDAWATYGMYFSGLYSYVIDAYRTASSKATISSSMFRAPNNTSIVAFRKADDSGDVTALSSDGSNNVLLQGGDAKFSTGGTFSYYHSGGTNVTLGASGDQNATLTVYGNNHAALNVSNGTTGWGVTPAITPGTTLDLVLIGSGTKASLSTGGIFDASGGFSVGGTFGITKNCTVTPTGITIVGGIVTAITGGTCT